MTSRTLFVLCFADADCREGDAIFPIYSLRFDFIGDGKSLSLLLVLGGPAAVRGKVLR